MADPRHLGSRHATEQDDMSSGVNHTTQESGGSRSAKHPELHLEPVLMQAQADPTSEVNDAFVNYTEWSPVGCEPAVHHHNIYEHNTFADVNSLSTVDPTNIMLPSLDSQTLNIDMQQLQPGYPEVAPSLLSLPEAYGGSAYDRMVVPPANHDNVVGSWDVYGDTDMLDQSAPLPVTASPLSFSISPDDPLPQALDTLANDPECAVENFAWDPFPHLRTPPNLPAPGVFPEPDVSVDDPYFDIGTSQIDARDEPCSNVFLPATWQDSQYAALVMDQAKTSPTFGSGCTTINSASISRQAGSLRASRSTPSDSYTLDTNLDAMRDIQAAPRDRRNAARN